MWLPKILNVASRISEPFRLAIVVSPVHSEPNLKSTPAYMRMPHPRALAVTYLRVAGASWSRFRAMARQSAVTVPSSRRIVTASGSMMCALALRSVAMLAE